MSLICTDSALRGLHRVLILTRCEAYNGRDPKALGDILDAAEYLVAILQNHEGLTEEEGMTYFRQVLHDMEKRFPSLQNLTAVFDEAAREQEAETQFLATAAL